MVSLENPTLENTIGAVLLGLAGASFFLGLSTLQVYIYYHRFPDDSLLLKSSVAILWVLDTFHLVLVIHAVWHYAVSGFGNIFSLNYIVWSVKLHIPVDTVLVVIVQSLYALRVIRLGAYHRSILGYLTAVAVTWGFVIGMVLSYKIYAATFYTDINKFSWVLNATLGTMTFIDTMIAVGMVYYLRKCRTQYTRLNSRISRMIQYTLSSGALTSACSLATMFTWILVPNTFNFVALSFLLTKLYAGSYYAMLNARQHTPLTPSEEIRLQVQLPSFHPYQIPTASSSPTSMPKIQVAQDPPGPMKTYPW